MEPMTNKPRLASDGQKKFIVQRLRVFEGLVTKREALLSPPSFLGTLTEERAEELIGAFRRLVSECEASMATEAGKKVCGTCRFRPLHVTNFANAGAQARAEKREDAKPGDYANFGPCENPTLLGNGENCPCWSADPEKVPDTHAEFCRNVRGHLCRFHGPDGQQTMGWPLEYVPGDCVIAQTEPHGRIEMFMYGEGFKLEVVR
jgi:hypothetical protein